MVEREVLAEIAAKSLLDSASLETAQPVQFVPAKTAAPRKARATNKSSPKVASKAAAPIKGGKPGSRQVGRRDTDGLRE
jgi:hypothetical protein